MSDWATAPCEAGVFMESRSLSRRFVAAGTYSAYGAHLLSVTHPCGHACRWVIFSDCCQCRYNLVNTCDICTARGRAQ